MSKSPSTLPAPPFNDPKHHLRIYQGDCLDILAAIPENSVDLVFTAPRYFTHATETIIWAAKNSKSRHNFNYKLMKEANRGKQMKSVWEIRPPESWEKKFGKHPTQKPVALLERILLASTNEGDLVLDPFSGSGTTLLTAFHLRRHALGCELSAGFLSLSLRRICSNLVQVDLSLTCVQFSLDPFPDPMDRSKCDVVLRGSCSGRASARPASVSERSCMSAQLQLVQQERRFYFIGRTKREVIFTVLADSLDEARQEFRASGCPDSDALFIIKTETEIYLA